MGWRGREGKGCVEFDGKEKGWEKEGVGKRRGGKKKGWEREGAEGKEEGKGLEEGYERSEKENGFFLIWIVNI